MLYTDFKKKTHVDKRKTGSPCESRLVSFLSDLNLSNTGNFRNNFSECLGQMFHLKGTVELSSVLESPLPKRLEPPSKSTETARNTFLAMQTDLVRFVAKSFLPTYARVQNRLPNSEALHAHGFRAGIFPKDPGKKSEPYAVLYEPYRKFYASLQRTVDIKVRRVRSDIREMISCLSPELAKLARLDRGFEDAMAGVPQESLARVPIFLEKRFCDLLDNHWHEIPDNPGPEDLGQWMSPGAWVSAFCSDMRELFFAELEVRLQPVLGMIESLPQPGTAKLQGRSPRL